MSALNSGAGMLNIRLQNSGASSGGAGAEMMSTMKTSQHNKSPSISGGEAFQDAKNNFGFGFPPAWSRNMNMTGGFNSTQSSLERRDR